VLIVVDIDFRFTYVLPGWEEFVHDASILAGNLSMPDGLKILHGKFCLGDVGYSCRHRILPLFRKTRYHISKSSVLGNIPVNAKELFNLGHSCLRITIERAFATLNNRFKVLDQKTFHTYEAQVKLVLACCILYFFMTTFQKDEVCKLSI
jgi:hypothetical protein